MTFCPFPSTEAIFHRLANWSLRILGFETSGGRRRRRRRQTAAPAFPSSGSLTIDSFFILTWGRGSEKSELLPKAVTVDPVKFQNDLEREEEEKGKEKKQNDDPRLSFEGIELIE